MYKILIIDDEVTIIEGLKKLVPWDEIDCKVVGIAEDGEEGLQQIDKLKPDIIISDIQMPKRSGLEMIKAMQRKKRDIKSIILTGYREFEYAQEAVNLGVVRFLLKPTKLEDIKDAVIEAIHMLDDERGKVRDIKNLRRQLNKHHAIAGNGLEGSQNEDEKMRFLSGQAIEYIKENYNQKLDLQTVADQLYISSWYLCKLFKKEVGSSFIELLNEVRIQEAKKLLTTTKFKVYEITERVGYSDTPYFSKTFKKHVGLTPNQYRNKMWKEQC
ncbi:response regulator transcription factor [Vallitalea okinawensis]|uniref:response regulator transcription factor n=1 Tax=Vallitalea okinawensis TaxID=2078660 RepID=UPI000CFCA933|nr:response regulator [Vallitalea okinawensis]